MRQSMRGLAWIALAVVLIQLVPTTRAATAVLQIQLGDGFAGEIGEAAGDTVRAHFVAFKGTFALVVVTPTEGSTLEPTVVAYDDSGVALDLGLTLPLRKRVLYFFRVPKTGSYAFEIGGTSGSGSFEAATKGRLPLNTKTTSLSGTVTNSLTGEGVPDVEVSVGPLVLVTDVDGTYATDVPVDEYAMTFAAADFMSQTLTVTLSPGLADVDVALEPVAPVIVTASISGDRVPGGALIANATVKILDGSTVEAFHWMQVAGPEAAIAGADTDSAMVNLASQAHYRETLIHVLSEPAIGPDELPPSVPPPHEEFPGGLQDRFQVVAINPLALEHAGVVALEVEVTTTSGTYGDEIEVHTVLPWKINPGLRTVPVGIPVLLHGKDQGSYDWTLDAPEASDATLIDAGSQNPMFVPDVRGRYDIEVTDASNGPLTLEIFASTWAGMIVDQDVDGRPVADGACLGCHGGFASDMFTPWAQTGHAEIFTNNLNTSTHYGPNCFGCHTVGFDQDVANGGADDAGDYEAFLGAGLLNNPGDNWTEVLDRFPALARLANIQCESCHGPHGEDLDNEAHGWYDREGDPRASLSSDVCATCHGEPLRHARFQQWQLSAHANYELAIDEGESGNCSRCHTGNGFLEWLPILMDDDPETDPTASISVTWDAEETHPQTCATCHDPHGVGTTSGINTNATVRISDNTPALIAGFTATDVGRGAICMTCHNSRRGLRNDETFAQFYLTSEAARAPHGSAQTDVLMGENAYLVEVGVRGAHSFVPDTCVDCHMEQTSPPDLLSYNRGGTNHTFFASGDICENCHSVGFRADLIQDAVEEDLDVLQGLIEDALIELIGERIALGNTIDLDGDAEITDESQIKALLFGEARGRQAITVTFFDGTALGPYRMTDVDVVDAFSKPIGQLYDFADPGLIKAGWNWNLIHNDGSLGVHNPQFSVKVLGAARDALLADAAGPLMPMKGTAADRRQTGVRPGR